MKAILVAKPKDLQIIVKPVPDYVGPTDVMIKTKVCGICGSDIHLYDGTSPLATYPRIPGHEVVGEVVETGSDVTTLQTGDRVVLEPIESCGHCYACRMNRPNICENLIVKGINVDGGFQEYYVAPEEYLHKFPETISWESAVMIEPFTIGAQICFRGDVNEGDLVLIIGAGAAGLSALEHARIRKAVTIVSDINEKRLAYAKKFGADYTLNPFQTDIRKEVKRISNGMMANVVIDAVGSPETMEQCISLASVAARIVCIGFTDTRAGMPLLDVTKKELTIVGSRLQTHQFKKCVEYFTMHKIHTPELITHRFPFTEAQSAVDLILSGNKDVGKVILLFA